MSEEPKMNPTPNLYFEVTEQVMPHLFALVEYIEHLPTGREAFLLAHSLAQITGLAIHMSARPGQEELMTTGITGIVFMTARAMGDDAAAIAAINRVNTDLEAAGDDPLPEIVMHRTGSDPTH